MEVLPVQSLTVLLYSGYTVSVILFNVLLVSELVFF